MAEVAPSAGGGGGNRNFLLIIGGLAVLLFIGLLLLAAFLVLPGLFGGSPVAVAPTPTPTRIVIPATSTRAPQPTATLVVVNLPTPELGVGERQLLVALGDANAVTLTTYEGGKPPLVQQGTWQLDAAASQLTLTLTSIDGKPFKDQLVFKVQGDQLVPVSFNRALHGDLTNVQIKRAGGSSSRNILPATGRSAGLGMPAAQATATPIPVGGNYTGGLPPPTEGERLIVMTLNSDGSAVLSTVEPGKPSILELGTWQASGIVVTVNLTLKDGAPVNDTVVLELRNGDLVGTNYDKDLHGPALVLKRDPAGPSDPNAPAVGTYSQTISLLATATAIPITATPILITATPTGGSVPNTGLGDDLALLFGGAVLLLGVIIVVRRMRSV